MNKLFLKQIEALADENRLKIISEIKKAGVLSCADAAKSIKVSQPTISHHINILIDSGLVKSKKTGKFLILSLSKKNFSNIEKYFSTLST